MIPLEAATFALVISTQACTARHFRLISQDLCRRKDASCKCNRATSLDHELDLLQGSLTAMRSSSRPLGTVGLGKGGQAGDSDSNSSSSSIHSGYSTSQSYYLEPDRMGLIAKNEPNKMTAMTSFK